jgi:transcriptional regulator with PAS, ATPase and Fis domain
VVPEVREVYARAARVAASRVSVLIRGESGTGKELLARYLHAASDRADAPLVTLNCAALPRDLLEAELFGVERGVATGVEARAGRFEAAHGGTLFLDEIGDMALETQARILRVLAEGEVYRVGGHQARPAQVRVISATNRDLDAMLADGRFRRDLYHRIADWVVDLPPLRARRADIPNLAAHFLAHAAAERGVHAAGISRAAITALEAHDWPGNVRQLEKEIGRAALFLEDGELLEASQLQPEINAAVGERGGDTLKSVLERTEKAHVASVLAACSGDVPAAAERLGIGVSTLYRRLKALGIS